MPEEVRRNPRLFAAIAAGVVALIAVVVLLVGGAAEDPPSTDAARLAPADALVYVHISTDQDREGVKKALDLLSRFPSLPSLRDGVFRRLAGGSGQAFSYTRDIRPWIGREAALVLLNTKGDTAGSLILAGVKDTAKATAFVRRTTGPSNQATYRGIRIDRFGSISTAFVDDFLAIGQDGVIRATIDRSQGRAPSLSRTRAYQTTTTRLPEGRFADAYVSRDGVRRLLAPQGGLLGAAGALLDQPALAGTSIGMSAEGGDARFTVASALDPRLAARQRPAPEFEPTLAGSVPKEAMAYLALTRLDRSATRLLAAAAAGAEAGSRLQALIRRAGRDLSRRAGVNIRREVLPLFAGETALWLAPSVPAPSLTLIARTDDEQQTREAFSRLQAPLARLFAPPSTGPGQAPTFEERDVDGTPAFQLKLAPGVELNYAVFDGKLVLSTSLDGIAATKDPNGSIVRAGTFGATLGDRPKKVSTLVFLDFSQLLRLAEQTGLTDSQAYLAVREDLNRIKAIGAAAAGQGDESTVELFVDIS